MGRKDPQPDADLTASGDLTVTDPDAGEDSFTAQANIAGSGGYDSFSIDANGHWTYTADNSQPAVQQLGAKSRPLTDTLAMASVDGTQHTLTVTITGTDEPKVSAQVTPPQPPTVTQVAGTHTTHLSGVLAGALGGWAIDNGQGAGVLSLQGQFGTLTIDPQTGHFDYQYVSNSGVIKHGSSGTIGHQVDTFHIMQHGTHTSDAEVRVNIDLESVHGHSGHHIDHTTLEGIDIVTVTQAQHDAPVQDAETLSVTIDLQDAGAPPPPPEGRSMDFLADQHPGQQGADAEGEQRPDIAATVYQGHPAETADEPSEPDQDLAAAAPAEEPPGNADQPPPVPDHLAPYLEMVGAEGAGNGGDQGTHAATSPYLEAAGVTPETATPPGPPDAAVDDAVAEVPDQDPFAAPDQTEDQVQSIEGTPGEEAPAETPSVPDADLDPHQHG